MRKKKFEGPLVFLRLFVIEPNLFPLFQGNLDDCKDLLIKGVVMLKEH